MVLQVFLMSPFEIVEITMCLEGFRHAGAAAARMCPACRYLTGIREKRVMLKHAMSTKCVKSQGCKGGSDTGLAGII